MDKVKETKTEFAARSVPVPDLSTERIFPGGIRVKALFAPEVKWRLVEEFGPECCNETKDGNLLFEREYTNEDNLISWILTFGDKAEILEPEDMREKFITTLKNIQTRYKGE